MNSDGSSVRSSECLSRDGVPGIDGLMPAQDSVLFPPVEGDSGMGVSSVHAALASLEATMDGNESALDSAGALSEMFDADAQAAFDAYDKQLQMRRMAEQDLPAPFLSRGAARGVSESHEDAFLRRSLGGLTMEPQQYEPPSPSLFVRNVDSSVDDGDLRDCFEAFGPVRSMYTQCKSRGFVMISYHNTSHAQNAKRRLQGKKLGQITLDIQFATPQDQGPPETMQVEHSHHSTILISGIAPGTTKDDVFRLFGQYGEIRDFGRAPNSPNTFWLDYHHPQHAERATYHMGGQWKKNEPRYGAVGSQQNPSYSMSSVPGVQLGWGSLDVDDDPTRSLQSSTNHTMNSSGRSSRAGSEVFGGFFGGEPEGSRSLPDSLYTQPVMGGPGAYGGGWSAFEPQTPWSNSRGPMGYGYPSSQATGYPSSQPTEKRYLGMGMGMENSKYSRMGSSVGTYRSYDRPRPQQEQFARQRPRPVQLSNQGRDKRGGNSSGRRQVKNKGDGNNRRSGKNNDQFILDVDRVTKGLDERTTLMIRNIPNKYSQKMLLSAVDERHRGLYDFFYLPIDFKNKCNVGYAFINFVEIKDIPAFYREFNNKKWEKFNSEKVCVIAYARIQGKSSLVSHFQNSSLMCEDPKCRPIIFHSEGPSKGMQESFPVGPNVRPRRMSNEKKD